MAKAILHSVRAGEVFIVWDDDTPAATITVDRWANPDLWTEHEAAESAFYIHRLIVDHAYSGHGLGAELIDWAGNTRRPSRRDMAPPRRMDDQRCPSAVLPRSGLHSASNGGAKSQSIRRALPTSGYPAANAVIERTSRRCASALDVRERSPVTRARRPHLLDA
jgi:GNAT superfamily N-acetyltransferase